MFCKTAGLDPYFACQSKSNVSLKEFSVSMMVTHLFLVNRAKYPSIKSKVTQLMKHPRYNLKMEKDTLFLERILRGIKKWLGSSTTLRYPLTAPLLAIWINLFGTGPMAIQARGASVLAVYCCLRGSEYLVKTDVDYRTLLLDNISFPIEGRSPGAGKKCFDVTNSNANKN